MMGNVFGLAWPCDGMDAFNWSYLLIFRFGKSHVTFLASSWLYLYVFLGNFGSKSFAGLMS